MIRFYIDHDSADGAVVGGLRRLGVDLLTSLEAGNARLDDPQQLAFASRLERTLYSANVGDFARLSSELLSVGAEHPGIIVRYDQRMPVGLQVRRLHEICVRLSPSDLANRLLYLDGWRVS